VSRFPKFSRRIFSYLFLSTAYLLLGLAHSQLLAQIGPDPAKGPGDVRTRPRPTIQAAHARVPIRLDGRLDDDG